MYSDLQYKCFAAVMLFAASALAGDENQLERSKSDIVVEGMSHPPQSVVTVQELSHHVPVKARKEMEKAEKARAGKLADEAITHYKQVILIDPEYVAARNNLAVIYLSRSNAKLALEQLEEAIKIDPRNPALFTNLTIAYHALHQLHDAERTARMAIDLDRAGTEPPMLLGMVLAEQRKFTEEALRCFRWSVANYPVAHLFAANILMTQGNLRDAKSEIESYLASSQQENREMAVKWLAEVTTQEAQSSATSTR
jgi:tetratricopeptide (TPR) repeat protein